MAELTDILPLDSLRVFRNLSFAGDQKFEKLSLERLFSMGKIKRANGCGERMQRMWPGRVFQRKNGQRTVINLIVDIIVLRSMTTVSIRFDDKDSRNLSKQIGTMNMERPSLLSAEQELQARKQQAKERRRKEKELSGKNVGHWNLREKRLYYTFLTLHQHHFLKNELRRSDKIFRSMSHYIGTRAADQCRSHHQKMEKKYKTFESILQSHKLDLEDYAKQEALKQSEPTQQSLHSPELCPSEEPPNTNACDELKMLLELPSLLMETPISIDHHFPHDMDEWPIRAAHDDIES